MQSGSDLHVLWRHVLGSYHSRSRGFNVQGRNANSVTSSTFWQHHERRRRTVCSGYDPRDLTLWQNAEAVDSCRCFDRMNVAMQCQSRIVNLALQYFWTVVDAAESKAVAQGHVIERRPQPDSISLRSESIFAIRQNILLSLR